MSFSRLRGCALPCEVSKRPCLFALREVGIWYLPPFSRLCLVEGVSCGVYGCVPLREGWAQVGFLLALSEEKDKVSLFALMRNPAALKGPAHDDR